MQAQRVIFMDFSEKIRRKYGETDQQIPTRLLRWAMGLAIHG
jgi:hypothetical protein